MTDGSATEAYERWIRAQGGDPDLDGFRARPSCARSSRRGTAW